MRMVLTISCLVGMKQIKVTYKGEIMETLTQCQLNQVYQFVSYNGDVVYNRHLRNLGLLPGTALVLISNEPGQPVIVTFKGTKIGLDQAIAKGIMVQKNNNKTQEKLTTLDQVGIGQLVQVVDFAAVGAVKRRLMDMGITKGTPVTIKKYAPLGDPIEISVRGYELSLRKQEASLILVEEVL